MARQGLKRSVQPCGKLIHIGGFKALNLREVGVPQGRMIW